MIIWISPVKAPNNIKWISWCVQKLLLIALIHRIFQLFANLFISQMLIFTHMVWTTTITLVCWKSSSLNEWTLAHLRWVQLDWLDTGEWWTLVFDLVAIIASEFIIHNTTTILQSLSNKHTLLSYQVVRRIVLIQLHESHRARRFSIDICSLIVFWFTATLINTIRRWLLLLQQFIFILDFLATTFTGRTAALPVTRVDHVIRLCNQFATSSISKTTLRWLPSHIDVISTGCLLILLTTLVASLV